MVPDGVVPSALVDFLVGVGVRRGEAREIAARIVAATCEAVQRASLARAREMAEQLGGMGVHAPELLGGAGRPTAQCDTCDDVARWLFHVSGGTPAGDESVRLAGARGGEVAARRVPPERRNLVREAVKRMHEGHGAVVCVVCAAPRMAEELGLDDDEGADDADDTSTRPPRRA